MNFSQTKTQSVYQIPRRSYRCHLGHEVFMPGTDYISLLESERLDYCLNCWEKILSDKRFTLDGKVYWRSCVPKKAKFRVSGRDERALELLKRGELDSCEEYLLAHFLCRRKIIQQKGEVLTDDGLERLALFEVIETEEVVVLKVVNVEEVSKDQIEALKVRLR